MLKICRICLHTNVELQDLSENEDLAEFYDELCDYSHEKGDKQVVCPACEGILSKCYSFKLLCCQADELLRDWKKKAKGKPPLQELYLTLPQHKNIPKSETDNIDTDLVKREREIEIPLDFVETNHFQPDSFQPESFQNDNFQPDNFNIVTYDGPEQMQTVKFDSQKIEFEFDKFDDIDNQAVKFDDFDIDIDSQTVKNDDDKIEDDHVNDVPMDQDDDDDDDDDLFLSQFVSVSKQELKEVKEESSKKSKRGKKASKKKEKGPKRTINHGNPFPNQKDLETIFDIEIFTCEEDALKDFDKRCITEPYMSSQHKCNICYTVHTSQKKLEFHQKWHQPSMGECICNICQMRFKKNGQLLRHKMNAHYGVYKCKICSLVTYYKNVMLLHADQHKGVQFTCKHCDSIFTHRSTYLTHLRTSHTSDHVCDICAKTFVSEMGLMMHQTKTHNKVFLRKKRRLKLQEKEAAMPPKLDENESASRCEECSVTFATHAVYIIHILNTPKHKEIANAIIACRFCGLEFDCRRTLVEHKRKMHINKYKKHNTDKYSFGPDGKLFKCQECGASGKSSLWLYRHHNSHHPDIPYAQQYSGDRKHLCDECGRSFHTPSALRHHKFKHTGTKPYICDTCPAKFRTKIGLKIHSEIHLPPKRECQHCGKKFFTASSLSNHMRSHIGDRRYKCEICGKGFLHNAALREHVRGVHYNIRRPRKNAQLDMNMMPQQL